MSGLIDSPQLEKYKQQAIADFQKRYDDLQAKRSEATEKYVRPAVTYARESAETRPLATVLLGVFFATSFFPLLAFALFSFGTLIVVGGGSLAFGLFWSSIFILGAVAALCGTLILTGLLTLTLCFWALVTYLTFRAMANLWYSPSISEGVKSYDQEIRALLLGTRPKVVSVGGDLKPEVVQGTKKASANANGSQE